MIYCVQALRNKNKEIKPQKKPKSPYLSPMQKLQLLNVKIAITQGKKLQIQRRGKDRLLFNPKHLQDEDKSQRRECKDKEIRLKRYWEI